MKSLIIFLILSLTLAVCPNGCSGNGVCNIDGNCDCFRQTGVALNGAYFEDYTYTGPDCSMSISLYFLLFRNLSKELCFFRKC